MLLLPKGRLLIMIRIAAEKDIPRLLDLLAQVCLVHHKGRPDVFNVGTKYNIGELKQILNDGGKVVLVWTDEDDCVQGYCFGIYQQYINHSVMTDIKTFYIDDLCVDETMRGKHVGKELYERAVSLARENGCYNITLNVWSCNPSAICFYESLGLIPQKIGMEQIL